MKFGKEFVSQMVPEWQEAYMNYSSLKAFLKEIQSFKHKSKPVARSNRGLIRNLTLYRTFSGLTQRSGHHQTSQDIENQVDILVNTVKKDGIEGPETTFLMAADEGGEKELVYFKRLDDEFNKVSKFYRSKVEEVMQEASVLNKQMDVLIAFRVKVENPKGFEERRVSRSVIDEESSTSDGMSDESVIDDGRNDTRAKMPASVETLKHVKFNTIRGILHLPDQTDLKFSKCNLKKAEEQLKKAFVKFYLKLRVLKSYSFLNILAFSKIMKKYDKITSRNASRPYMKMVENSYIGSSDEVNKLMERVEVTFIKHFANSNRSKGMSILRPTRKRERHRLTFYMGFLLGCTVALIVSLGIIVHARNILDAEGAALYMDTMFPLYSLFGFVCLHMVLYAANIYFWRRYRVNYAFIFGSEDGTELGYREVLLLSFTLSVLALACVLANLDMEMDPVTNDYEAITELLPLGLVLLIIAIMLCPFNIIYRPSRVFLLVSLSHCILLPLYKVTLPDFWIADQLTSQVQSLRSLEFYICYYGRGDYKLRKNTCASNSLFRTVSFLIAEIPFWWRLIQCLRRLFEERDVLQAYNSLKYFLTIVAVSTRTAYIVHRGYWWKLITWITSILATIFSTYWDIVHDWGLLQRNSKNRWLRDKLLVSHKSVYYVAMVLDALLRLAWVQTVLGLTIFSLRQQTMLALVACLEIIRRGMWNFFRLENEHLNNVGKYRAFKSVPLPFNYDQDEDKDD